MPLRLVTGDTRIEDSAGARQWVESNAHADCVHRGDCAAFWLDIIEPDPDAIDWLADHFHFHPLTIEDLRSPNERGKLETYDSYLFLIAHSLSVGPPLAPPARVARQAPTSRRKLHAHHQHPHYSAPAESGPAPAPSDQICGIESHELHAYLGKSFLVTVHDTPMPPLDKVWGHATEHDSDGDPSSLQHGLDYVLYRLLDNTVDGYFTTLEATANQIDYLEDTVIDRPDRGLLEDVFTVKRNLVAIRRQATPMREALNELANPGNPFIHDKHQIFFRDVHNLLVAVYELADTQRDSTSGVLDAYLSSVNNNLSVIMKRMTIIATVFMPLSVIVGFGGMNFVKFIPYDNAVMFWGLMASLVVVPVIMLLWFYRSRWL